MLNLQRPGLVVFDMDSTLITIECIDELAALVGKKDQVSVVTEAAMRGELDFAQSLRARVELLAGVKQQQLAQLFQPIPLSQGARQLVQWLHDKGWYAAVVSGGFTWFTEQLAREINLDAQQANRLLWHNAMLTGEVAEPIVDAASKARFLQELAQRWSIPLANTVAVGDGANDRDMLEVAGYGVAYCAKPALREVADYSIDTPDLMILAEHLATFE
ncbi:phosphoserine phosphatase SerB [Pseudidiomarina insulisalsae]|uniref:Phosphoserine phosphatase n=1 Tax=Pseudidiomarina insulisalsae TaxID=575789 RepID=A0A432Y8L1_9GAMM|nr:phosphoserine phosphatase SerB [Pseudidiomarina insulisalsae]RUO57325.1 phosphoserine phosphatase SerB [Pseudidiomarina insulisalsae]